MVYYPTPHTHIYCIHTWCRFDSQHFAATTFTTDLRSTDAPDTLHLHCRTPRCYSPHTPDVARRTGYWLHSTFSSTGYLRTTLFVTVCYTHALYYYRSAHATRRLHHTVFPFYGCHCVYAVWFGEHARYVIAQLILQLLVVDLFIVTLLLLPLTHCTQDVGLRTHTTFPQFTFPRAPRLPHRLHVYARTPHPVHGFTVKTRFSHVRLLLHDTRFEHTTYAYPVLHGHSSWLQILHILLLLLFLHLFVELIPFCFVIPVITDVC